MTRSPAFWKPGQWKTNSAESSRSYLVPEDLWLRYRSSLLWLEGHMPNESLVSYFLEPPPPNPPWTGERQWAQLRDSGEVTPRYVPKALSAEPQWLLPKPVGDLLSLIFFVLRIRPMKTLSTGQVFSRFSGRQWRACFPHCFSLQSFSSSLLGLQPSQNAGYLASGPSEAQAQMSHCKNSVRDTAIGKRWIC